MILSVNLKYNLIGRESGTMAKAINMFREFSMEYVEGYNKLSNDQKGMFDITYKKHLSSLPLNKQANFTENELEKIETIMIEEKVSVLKVYFNHGDCYLYLPKNVWIKTT